MKKKKWHKVLITVLAVIAVIAITLTVLFFKLIGDLRITDPTENEQTSESVMSDEDSTDENSSTEENKSSHEDETDSPSEEPATANPDETTSKAQENTTENTSEKTTENTTSKNPQGSDSTTSKPDETTTSAQISKKSEYNIYKSGHFYATGTMTDDTGETVKLDLAVTENSVYLLSSLDGIDLALLNSGKKVYMLYPKEKKYMEVNSLVLSMLGDSEALFDTSSFGFKDMPEANKLISDGTETVNGVKCNKYHYNKESGTIHYVYLSGDKLVRIKVVDTNSAVMSVLNFDSISATVPKDKINPPSDYKKTGMLEFFSLLDGLM